MYDTDRKVINISRELYFYPHWNDLSHIREILRNERVKMWKELNKKEKIIFSIINRLRNNKITHAILLPVKTLLIIKNR